VAAALLEKVAQLSSRRWAEAAAAHEGARRLRLLGEELVEHDLHAYLVYMEARRSATGLDAARSSTVDVPLDIVRAGAEVVALADELARMGNPNLRADAVAAAILAAAAVEAAAMLVEVNVGDSPGDARLDEARKLASGATALAGRLAPPARAGGQGRARARSRGSGRV
jgi:formiminotetrahydrofolate cyclodeaminase